MASIKAGGNVVKRLIYRCKRKSCGKVRRIEYPFTRAVDLGGGHTRTIHYRVDLLRGEVRAGSESICICGNQISGDEITGVSTSHKCDPRCVNAIGPLCECSCGGKNHGGAYDVAIAEMQTDFAWA